MSSLRSSAWESSLAALTASVKAKVREMRRDGTTAMSRANFRQIVSTRGVTVPVDQFDALLASAIEAARVTSYFYGEVGAA